MPNIKKGESRKDFVARAVPILLREKTAKTPSQAAAIANSMYREKKKKRA